MPVEIFYREELREYDFGPGHPFRGDRYGNFTQFLMEKLPEDDNYRILKGEPATDEELLLICEKDYIDFTKNYFRAANMGLSLNGRFARYHSPDNRPIGRPGKLEEAARFIVGQAKMAADTVQEGSTSRKAVSLGGGMHHAKPNYGEGFCIYNDVAFTARYLTRKYGLERVLILDTDAHAGNGTMEYFYSDPKVLFIDLHQDPRTLYPGTGFVSQIGDGKGKGYTINVPVPMYSSDDSYRLVFDEIILPVNEEFRPQLIIRNGGSDPHFADELTALGLTMEGFRMIGEKVGQMSTKTCDGKVIDLIGSGYNKRVLPHGWLALISGLAAIKTSIEEPVPAPQGFKQNPSLSQTVKVVAEVKRVLKDYWRCFR